MLNADNAGIPCVVLGFGNDIQCFKFHRELLSEQTDEKAYEYINSFDKIWGQMGDKWMGQIWIRFVLFVYRISI